MLTDYTRDVLFFALPTAPPPPSPFLSDGGSGGGKYAGLTPTQLIDAYKQGRITADDLSAELSTRGYTPAAVKEVLAANPAPSIKPPSLSGSAGLLDTGLTSSQAQDLYANNPQAFSDWLDKSSLSREQKALAQQQYDQTAAAAAAKNAPPTLASIEQGIQQKQQTANLTSQAQADLADQAKRNFVMGNSGGGSSPSNGAAAAPPTTASPVVQTRGTPPPSATQSGPPVTGDPKKDAFVAQMWPTAVKYSQQTGIPPQVFVAINGSESNWGAAGSLFGIKGPSPSGQSANYDTHENVNGQNVGENDQFATYNSPAEGYDHFLSLISSGRYAPAWQQYQKTGDWQGLLQGINQAGYATDPNWASMIGSMANNLGAGTQQQATAGIGGSIMDAVNKAKGMAADAQTQPAATQPTTLPAGWHNGPTGYEQDINVAGAGGGYKGTGVLNTDPNGNVSETGVGWNNSTQGNSLDPRGAWWGTGLDAASKAAGLPPDQLIEQWRALPTVDLVKTIRQVLGRDPTPADLYSPPGGAEVNGDPMQMENAGVIAKTGYGRPGLGYEARYDPDNPVNPTGPIRQNSAPVMTQGQAQQYNTLGGFVGDKGGDTLASLTGVDESQLGGPGSDRAAMEEQAREGEQATSNDYGTGAAPASVRQAIMAAIARGELFDPNDIYRSAGLLKQADGGIDMVGAENPNVPLDWLSRQTQPVLLNNGVQGNSAADWWNTDDQTWQKPSWTAAGNSASNSQNWSAYLGPASEMRWNSNTGMYEKNPNYDEQQSYARGVGKYPIYGGSHPNYLNPFGGTYFANGGILGAGMGEGQQWWSPQRSMSGFLGMGQNPAEQNGWQSRASIPLGFGGNMFTYAMGQQHRFDPFNGTGTPQTMPTSWAPTPAAFAAPMAQGGGLLAGMGDRMGQNNAQASGPVITIDARTGRPISESGEDGAEAQLNVPLTRPAADPFIQQIQQMPQIQQMAANATGGRFSSTMLQGLNGPQTQTGTMQGSQQTDPALIAAAAKAARPKVKLAI